MTANYGCLFCLGTGLVHTYGGTLGDTIAGPALCAHDGSWRVVAEAERAQHLAVVERLRAQARRLENTAADTPDITKPRHEHPAERDQ